MSIKSELKNLNDVDTISLLMFALYKMRDTKETSALSELAFVLDKDNFINLCEYFGGSTITIPTLEEVDQLLYGLMMFQYLDIQKLSYEEAMLKLGDRYHPHTIRASYRKIKEVLSEYEFTSRNGN